MFPDMQKLKSLPPFILHEISENLAELADEIRRFASGQEDTTEQQLDQFQRETSLRDCCREINACLDRGTELQPAIARTYQKLGSNRFTMADLAWFWQHVGRHTRPKRVRVQRDRRIMELFQAGLTDAAIASAMQKESPAWAGLHAKTVGKVRRDKMRLMDRGQYR